MEYVNNMNTIKRWNAQNQHVFPVGFYHLVFNRIRTCEQTEPKIIYVVSYKKKANGNCFSLLLSHAG